MVISQWLFRLSQRIFSRHIHIRRYFVRHMVSVGVLKFVPLRTHLMVAHALTKSLSSPAHIKHREIMLGRVPFSFADRTLRRTAASRTLRRAAGGGR